MLKIILMTSNGLNGSYTKQTNCTHFVCLNLRVNFNSQWIANSGAYEPMKYTNKFLAQWNWYMLAYDSSGSLNFNFSFLVWSRYPFLSSEVLEFVGTLHLFLFLQGGCYKPCTSFCIFTFYYYLGPRWKAASMIFTLHSMCLTGKLSDKQEIRVTTCIKSFKIFNF